MKWNQINTEKKQKYWFVIGLIKNNLTQYRILKFYVRHGMIVDKVQGVNFFYKMSALENI